MTTFSPEVDAQLARIESLFQRFAKKHDLLVSTTDRGKKKLDITRWPWDAPNISLRWPDQESGIRKNLEVTLDESGMFVIDASAWLDVDEADGKRRRRYKTYRLPKPISSRELDLGLQRALDKLLLWEPGDLKSSAELATDLAT